MIPKETRTINKIAYIVIGLCAIATAILLITLPIMAEEQATQVINADYIANITDNEINTYITPRIVGGLFWDTGQNLTIEVRYNSIEPIDESYEYFTLTNEVYYPKMHVSAFHTCLFDAQLSVNECLNVLVYTDNVTNYNGQTYYSMLNQVTTRNQRVFNQIKEYKQIIQYNQVINTINNNINGVIMYE